MFQNGPKFTFKTDSVRFAEDLLIRNQKDAFIFTGVVWSCSINGYLSSDENLLRDKMTEMERVFLTSLLYLGVLQATCLAILKFVDFRKRWYDDEEEHDSQQAEKTRDDLLTEETIKKIITLRERSCCDRKWQKKLKRTDRKSILKWLIIVSFFLLPIIGLIGGVTIWFLDGMSESDANEELIQDNRLLSGEATESDDKPSEEKEEEKNSLILVRIWICLCCG